MLSMPDRLADRAAGQLSHAVLGMTESIEKLKISTTNRMG